MKLQSALPSGRPAGVSSSVRLQTGFQLPCNRSSANRATPLACACNFPVRDGLIWFFKYLRRFVFVNLSAGEPSRSSCALFRLALRKAANRPCDNNTNAKRRSPARVNVGDHSSLSFTLSAKILPSEHRASSTRSPRRLPSGADFASVLAPRTRARLRLYLELHFGQTFRCIARQIVLATAIPGPRRGVRGTAPCRWRR